MIINCNAVQYCVILNNNKKLLVGMKCVRKTKIFIYIFCTCHSIFCYEALKQFVISLNDYLRSVSDHTSFGLIISTIQLLLKWFATPAWDFMLAAVKSITLGGQKFSRLGSYLEWHPFDLFYFVLQISQLF